MPTGRACEIFARIASWIDADARPTRELVEEDALQALEYSYESLARHIAGASEEMLVVAGAMCLYRISPVLGRGGSEIDVVALESVEDWGSDRFPATVESAVAVLLAGLPGEDDVEPGAELQHMAAAAVRGFFDEDSSVVDWSDRLSAVSLDISQELDGLLSEADPDAGPRLFPAGTFPDLTPLEAAEIVDQVDVLVSLSAGETARVLEISKNGQNRIREIFEAISAAGE